MSKGLTLICVLLNVLVVAQRAPHVLVRYATAHVGNGEVISNAYFAYQGNEITMLSDANSSRINILDYDSIIDAEGMHLYPGFILMDSKLGLTEIDAVRATHDFTETGEYNPNVRAQPAFNAESKVISTVRTNGVLMAQIAPAGGVISGSSSATHLNGWNWPDATVRADEGIFLNWPSRYKYQGWWAEPKGAKPNEKYGEQRKEIIRYFEEAKAYAATQPEERNLRFDAMKGLFSGDQRLYVRVEWVKDILDVVQFLRESGVKNYALVGATEALLVANAIKDNNIPIVIDRVHKLPENEDDPIDAPFTFASQLRERGIEVAFATNGSMEAMISRNLPFQVGTAVEYGMDEEDAIRSLTLVPAKLMGIDQRYGTLESGKSATFFLSAGDAFEMMEHDVIHAVVDGKVMPLTNHQTELYRKFSRKYGTSID